MERILLVEDEKVIRDELRVLLENAGYGVECAADFENVERQVRETEPDLILLDINLPGKDGYRICSAVRRFCETPVLFITGRDTAMDELQALTVGGDDYIAKPYNVPVLLARINLLLKRKKAAGENGRNDTHGVLEYKGVKLKPVAGTLEYHGKETELTKTELKMMHYLFSHTKEIVPRMDLVEYLWDNEIHIDDNTLSVNMMRIREKLRTLGVDELIQTKRGMGYKV